MTNKNKTVWSGRFKSSTSKSFQRIGASINVDKRLYEQDIFASKIHTQMLIKKKIIPVKDGKKIIKGLDKIKGQIKKGKLFYDIIYNPPETNFLKKGKDLGMQP